MRQFEDLPLGAADASNVAVAERHRLPRDVLRRVRLLVRPEIMLLTRVSLRQACLVGVRGMVGLLPGLITTHQPSSQVSLADADRADPSRDRRAAAFQSAVRASSSSISSRSE